MVDVAERAGVTVSTASRALARRDGAARDAARVKPAAREPSATSPTAWRSLITGTSATIAIVVPQLVNFYFAEICRAAQARRVRDVQSSRATAVRSKSARHAPAHRRRDRRHHHLLPAYPPATYTHRVRESSRLRGAHAVLLDQVQIVNTQIEHLRFLGHRRIAWIAGPKGYWTSSIRRRYIERLRVRFPIEIIEGIPPTFEGGQEAAPLDPSITAVATFNDSQASGILSAAEHGIPVPEDLSVIGSDGTRLGEMVIPPLTTVQSPLEQMAKSAVSLLLDHRRRRRATTIVETLPVELVVRSSTAPLPLSRPPIKVEDK